MYYINEIFESIQGEGNYCGVYSLFIRFHFCNFTCNWCDTKYTWNKRSGQFKEYSAEELKEIICSSKAHHIIFTGGEPGLYPLDQLVVENKMFHVETNGFYLPSENLSITLSDGTHFQREKMDEKLFSKFNWVVSPKLANSYQEFSEKAFEYWVDKPFSIYKFIITSTADLAEIKALQERFGIPVTKIYIGIEGYTLNSQLQPDLVDEIIKYGFNYSPRLHVLLWGSKRGK